VYREKDPTEIFDTYEYFKVKLPKVPVIYGGSVNKDNVNELVSIDNLGGVLVGNASLDPKHFLDLVEAFE